MACEPRISAQKTRKNNTAPPPRILTAYLRPARSHPTEEPRGAVAAASPDCLKKQTNTGPPLPTGRDIGPRSVYAALMELITATEQLAAVCARLARPPIVTEDTEIQRETP